MKDRKNTLWSYCDRCRKKTKQVRNVNIDGVSIKCGKCDRIRFIKETVKKLFICPHCKERNYIHHHGGEDSIECKKCNKINTDNNNAVITSRQ